MRIIHTIMFAIAVASMTGCSSNEDLANKAITKAAKGQKVSAKELKGFKAHMKKTTGLELDDEKAKAMLANMGGLGSLKADLKKGREEGAAMEMGSKTGEGIMQGDDNLSG